jgi:thioredoxin 1
MSDHQAPTVPTPVPSARSGAALGTVTDATFDRDVLGAAGPVLVDYWAPWCGPCYQVAPVLERIAAERNLTVLKLNADENPQTAARFAVLAMPTLQLWVGGEVVQQVVGARSKAALLRELDPYLP